MKNNRIRRDGDRPVAVQFSDDKLWVTLKDGRVIGTPLAWYPWLASATIEQRQHVELYPFSVYWPDLDDGIDIQAMVTGHWTAPVDAVTEQAAP